MIRVRLTDGTKRSYRHCILFGVALALLSGCASAGDAKTWTVTTTEDSSIHSGAFRYILANAGNGDTITFSSTGSTLTSQLYIRKNVTIEGPATIRQTGYQHRIFVVNDGVTAALKNLMLKGGVSSHGGALCNYGDLTMEGCTLTGNSAWIQGGAVLNGATLTMKNCTVSENASAEAGGIINFDVLKMTSCTIVRNIASGSCGGVFSYGETQMKDCVVEHKSASGCCGGVSHANGTLKAEECAIRYNLAGGDGGGIGNSGVLEMKKCSIANNDSGGKGGGIYLPPEKYGESGTVTLTDCAVTNNAASSGGGVFNSVGRDNCSLKDKTAVKNNAPDQISGPYKADSNCTIGTNPNRSSAAFSGYSGETEPEPRSIVGDADVTEVKSALADPTSDIFAAVRTALSNDVGGISGDATASLSGMTASLYYANTFENVAIESRDLVVEYTASYPERVRYYALFSRADGSGFDMPGRGVQFELQPGQTLPDGVTPPDFYVPGEGLMTWRNVVTDNGSYDLEPTTGIVTFRVCSVRAAEATGDTGSGGGCNAGAGGTEGASLALLFAVPLLYFPNPKRNAPKRRERSL